MADMDQRIIYPSLNGSIAVVVPAPNCNLPVTEIARKDVPAGLPYLIIATNDLPSDRDFRGAWEADFGKPDGYGIGSEAWFAEQEAAA